MQFQKQVQAFLVKCTICAHLPELPGYWRSPAESYTGFKEIPSQMNLLFVLEELRKHYTYNSKFPKIDWYPYCMECFKFAFLFDKGYCNLADLPLYVCSETSVWLCKEHIKQSTDVCESRRVNISIHSGHFELPTEIVATKKPFTLR